MIESEFIPIYIKILPLIFSLGGVSLTLLINSTYFIELIKIDVFESKYWKKFVSIFSFFSNKWNFDIIYNRLINYNVLRFSYNTTFKVIDKGILEIIGPFGFWETLLFTAGQFRRFQRGLVFNYAIFILFIFILFYIFMEYLVA
jgi:NADH-ubiquinone oxidoreductase chain 5